jgi:rhodanese-related sulfurtransferase
VRLLNIALILAVSLGISAYASWIRKPRPPATDDPAMKPVDATEIPLLRLAEAKALYADPGTVFVDVRSASDFSFGRIAGAISVPEDKIEERLADLRPRLESAKRIIVYCGSRDCGTALWAGIRLRQAGFTQTAIFPGGYNAWYVDENPIER